MSVGMEMGMNGDEGKMQAWGQWQGERENVVRKTNQ